MNICFVFSAYRKKATKGNKRKEKHGNIRISTKQEMNRSDLFLFGFIYLFFSCDSFFFLGCHRIYVVKNISLTWVIIMNVNQAKVAYISEYENKSHGSRNTDSC